MQVTSLGYRTDLMVRRMAGAEVSDHGTFLLIRTETNPGFWWGNFLLLKEVPGPGEWGRWLKRFEQHFPQAQHVALGVDAAAFVPVDEEELAALDLEAGRDTVLTATGLIPPREPNVSADIRPLRSDEDWAQAVQLRLSIDEGPPPPGHLKFVERKTAEYRASSEAGLGAWFGAFVEGRMRCGAGLFSDGSGVARYQNVETHPEDRRKGLASAVVYELGMWGMNALAADKLVIVADPSYHAIDLYRRLGFADAESQLGIQRAPRD